MKRFVFLFLGLSSFLLAETSMWKVEKNKDVVYIGGTIHLLRQVDYPLPIEYEKAYALSDKIYFETDLSAINDTKIQQRLFSKMLLKNGQTLSSLLSKDTYKTLEEYAKKYSINIKEFESFKPGMLVLMITVSEFRKSGFSSIGVDSYYEKKALKDKKAIGELETVEEQLNYISSFGEGNEDNFVIQSLKDLNKIQTLLKEMISSWRNGNMKKLNTLFIDDMKLNFPKLYNSLIVERNNNWIPLIEKMFNNDEKELVLVGVGHLTGEEGVIEQLKKLGYKVEKF